MDDSDDEDSTGVFALPKDFGAPAPTARRPYLVLLGGNDGLAESYSLERTKVLGRDPGADIRLEREGISRRHVRVVVDGERLVLQDLESTNGTFVNGARVETVVLAEGDTVQIGSALLRLAFRDGLEDASFQALRESARRDALTGAYNRRYLDERLDAELAYAKRHKTLISVVLTDVDHFKKVNDTFGHLAGDAVLQGLAAKILATIRREDVLARYGGEELVVICRDIEREGARLLAERIRVAAESLRIAYDGRVIPVTISAGVASGPDASDHAPSALLKRADEALYEAKRAGRNRVVAR